MDAHRIADCGGRSVLPGIIVRLHHLGSSQRLHESCRSQIKRVDLHAVEHEFIEAAFVCEAEVELKHALHLSSVHLALNIRHNWASWAADFNHSIVDADCIFERQSLDDIDIGFGYRGREEEG